VVRACDDHRVWTPVAGLVQESGSA
jgi:hypothetical protein